MKTLNKWVSLAIALIMAFNITSCKDDDDINAPVNQDPLRDYEKIGEQELSGMTIAMYMAETPFVGYNQVAVRVMRSGSDEVAENATLDFMPMMQMTSMAHSTPHEGLFYRQDLDAYAGSVTFIMPTTQDGSWSIEVVASMPGVVADSATFEVTVVPKDDPRLYSFTSQADSLTTYFVALRNPLEPEVGLNDFELMIYRRENMMNFPPADGLVIEMDPQMPSMGHGSPNNEDPVSVVDGYYKGRVNFTMSGHWQVNLVIENDSNEVLDDQGYFDIRF